LIAIDVESLIAPISPETPSGENLEYDPEFVEMERAAQGTPEQQYGSTIIEAKEPEWDDVAKAAAGLLKRTHDLRIGLYLARSSLKTSGWPAFRDALKVLNGFVGNHWDSVHPQLDPDDDLDPTTRVNTIATLCDNGAMLNLMRTATIVSSRAAGQFSHRDLQYATGELPYSGPADAKPKMSLIDAAFADCDLDQLKKTAQAVSDSVDLVKQIEQDLTKQVGAGNARSLEPAAKELDAIRKILIERLGRRGASLAVDAPAAAGDIDVDVDIPDDSDEPGESRGTAARIVVRDWDADIESREEAIKAIDKVCQYFERFEPSSPLPLLLRRAMRLSTKSFLEILRDISPDGLTQAETLGGMSSEEYTQMAAASAAAAAALAKPAKPTPAKPAAKVAASVPPPPPPPSASSSAYDY